MLKNICERNRRGGLHSLTLLKTNSFNEFAKFIKTLILQRKLLEAASVIR